MNAGSFWLPSVETVRSAVADVGRGATAFVIDGAQLIETVRRLAGHGVCALLLLLAACGDGQLDEGGWTVRSVDLPGLSIHSVAVSDTAVAIAAGDRLGSVTVHLARGGLEAPFVQVDVPESLDAAVAFDPTTGGLVVGVVPWEREQSQVFVLAEGGEDPVVSFGVSDRSLVGEIYTAQAHAWLSVRRASQFAEVASLARLSLADGELEVLRSGDGRSLEDPHPYGDGLLYTSGTLTTAETPLPDVDVRFWRSGDREQAVTLPYADFVVTALAVDSEDGSIVVAGQRGVDRSQSSIWLFRPDGSRVLPQPGDWELVSERATRALAAHGGVILAAFDDSRELVVLSGP